MTSEHVEKASTSLGRILIVDDDQMIRDLIKYNLENEDYTIESSTNASDALDLDLTLFSLIISEVDLPGQISGMRFVQMIKQNPDTAPVPVIFCTGRDSEDDIIAGFNSGADDYILKPFSLREMIARVKAVLRRHSIMMRRREAAAATSESHVISFETLVVDLSSQRVAIDGENVQMTRTEFQILSLFIKNRNRLFSREEIFQTIRPGQELGSDRSVDVNISRVRKKLGRYAVHVVNKSGRGYGFLDQ